MAKWIIAIAALFFVKIDTFAQKLPLEIKNSSNKLYLEHNVGAKEGLYSIGRIYNVAPKELAAYNKMSVDKGLTIGQLLLIPLSNQNFLQADGNTEDMALIPVYHTVRPHETLFRLSTNYNKVSIESLKKWNHLTSNAISSGVPLIIGFLKVDKDQSSLSSNAINVIDTTPVVVVTMDQPKPKAPPEKEEVMEDTTKIEEVVVEKKPTIDFNGGTFKALFEEQNKSGNTVKDYGIAGIFKSTSGWQDGKYYCFSNDAPSGSILKITDNATGKSVYAKVLDIIPDIKQNEGLSLIISNAAAEELGVGDKRFNCTLSYVKED